MKKIILITVIVLLHTITSLACNTCLKYDNEDFEISKVVVKHNGDLSATIWEVTVNGQAGDTTPKAIGQLDGAPVLAYVFPTTLKPEDVGFNQT